MGLQKRLFHLIDLVGYTDKVFLRDWLPINTDSIMDADDMRRGKSTNFFTMSNKQLPHEGNS